MDAILKPTKERIEARKKNAERMEKEKLRPFTLEDHYFLANNEDAKFFKDSVPFEGERYEQPTKDNGLKKVEGSTVIPVFANDNGKYRKYFIEADDFNDFWINLDVKTSIAAFTKVDKKKAEKKAEK